MWISTHIFVYYYIASFRCRLSESISECYYIHNFQIMQEKFSNYENFLNTFRVLLTKYREKYINYNILYTLYIMKSKEQTAVFAVSYSKDVIA